MALNVSEAQGCTALLSFLRGLLAIPHLGFFPVK